MLYRGFVYVIIILLTVEFRVKSIVFVDDPLVPEPIKIKRICIVYLMLLFI